MSSISGIHDSCENERHQLSRFEKRLHGNCFTALQKYWLFQNYFSFLAVQSLCPGIMDEENQTTTTEFLLLGFSDLRALQGPLFWLVLLVYLITFLGNSLIIFLTQTSPVLHSPMYFFLRHLSMVELLYTTDIVPRVLADLTSSHPQAISFRSCAAQMYFFIVLGISECCLLTAMAYDRYAAICQPLHYSTLMNHRACIAMVGTSWIMGIITATTHSSLIFTLPFPSRPIIPHFLCDILPVLRLASAGKHRSEISVMTATVVFIMIPFSLIVTSYARILGAILAIASSQSRRKVFSTCSSHLLVVSLFFGTASITYIRPRAGSSVTTDRILSLFYTVVTPMLNPIIYTLRNKEVIGALKHMKRQVP